ncbi:MAG: glycoside hydrolase family 43 protein [Oscillospiraceae bacterium]|nr:glycoside hydrolase family 43 protein [Oscillospiraceae bacterium]
MNENNFPNPIMPGADPFVLLHDGTYYMYCTVENSEKLTDHHSFHTSVNKQDGYYVYRSQDLQSWENMGLCLSSTDVMGDKWFWAPEVLYRNGKFYMVYSAEEHIGMAVADSPLGPFRQTEKKWLYAEKAIDGHMFVDDDGTVYLYYVRLHNGNQIYVAKLSEDLLSIDVLYEDCLIKAEEPWETRDCLVAEGPFVLKHKGIYYLTYSANHTRCRDYAVGVAMSQSPVGPFEKFKGNPILHKNERFCGVGHHSFTTSRDGKVLICAYHCHDSYECFRPRRVCLNTARFVPGENGMDELIINGPQ